MAQKKQIKNIDNRKGVDEGGRDTYNNLTRGTWEAL
jgi:hypothetical protein